MHRDNGIAFLWTRERWERDYLIFVVRDRFARLYAFGPGRFDAACRLNTLILSLRPIRPFRRPVTKRTRGPSTLPWW